MNLFLVAEGEPVNFLPLLIVLLLAFLVPILLARFRRVPVVVGEILAGVLIGSAGLGLVHEDVALSFMGDIGLAFLMFLAGMEIDFNPLFPSAQERNQNSGSNILIPAGLSYAFTFLLALLGAYLLKRIGLEGDLWLLALILSATSLGVLMPVLKERGLTRTPFGQTIFFSATLADFVTVILLTIYLIVESRGLDIEVFSIGLLFIFFFAAYRLGLRFTRIPAVRAVVEELSKATVQLKIRGAIAILLAFVVLAEFVNAELILGAFLAGMVISLIKSPQDDGLVHNLEAFGFGFFIPVFFILVGVNLDLGSLWNSPQALLVLPVFLVISILVKLVPMVFFKGKLTWREMLAGGILLNTHLSLEIAVAVIGLRAGLLAPATSTGVTLFAILTLLIMPFLFSLLIPAIPPSRKRSIVICGAGPEGMQVARQLDSHDEEVSIYDEDETVVERAREAGFNAVNAKVEGIKSILNPMDVKGVLAICADDQRNLMVCRLAVQANISTIVALVNDPANLAEFEQLGVMAYVATMSHYGILAMIVRNPDLYTLLTTESDERDVRELFLYNPSLAGLRLREIEWPGEVLVLSIRRDGAFIIPNGSVQIELLDRLTLLGCHDDLERVADLLRTVS